MAENGELAALEDRSRTLQVADTIQELHVWLHTTSVDLKDQHTAVDAFCCKLREVGLPVDRFFCGAQVLHPLVAARAWKWIDGTITDFSWTRQDAAKRLNTPPKASDPPMFQMINGAPFVRVRVTDPVLPDDCDWMKTDHYTDLFGLPTPNTGNGKLEGGFTWATKAPGGFTEDHIAVLRGTLLSLATVLRVHIQRFTSQALLMTYLGEDAGTRVHNGEILRGEGLTIRSVVWFSDIRGFTKMSGELKRLELLDVINGVFEVTAEIIKEHKGQTLKFMGDGLMAIFRSGVSSFQRASLTGEEKKELDDQAATVCRNARLAATQVQARLAALKQEREAKGLRGASVGVGLHYGDVSYGNVGARERLDFTVLGPHVNLASRTESLCSKLNAKVLCTSDFVQLDSSEPDLWTSRGEHEVKGVAEPVHIYELKE